MTRPVTARPSGIHVKTVLEFGEEGYFEAHCPLQKSCWSQGKTREAALQHICAAIALYLEATPNEMVDDSAAVIEWSIQR